jgi:hypothetical protein
MKRISVQHIGNIVNSNAIIINGNVSVDGQVYKDIQNMFVEILRKDFERFSIDAINNTKSELNEFLEDLLRKLVNEQQVQLIEKFNNPAIQVFLHDTLIGYISNEDNIMKEYIVDILIDRLKVNSNSTEKAILNEAIKLIPNLNLFTSSLIVLMNLRHQVVNTPFSFMLDLFFNQLSPFIDNSCNINNLDIEYIIQNNCTKTISGIYFIDTYENHLLKQYDLYFRKKIGQEDFDSFRTIHPEIMHKVNDDGTCMFIFDKKNGMFSDVNTTLFYKRLKARKQEYLIPLVEELKKFMPLLTEKEVREYLCSINQNWLYACELLNSPALKTVDLNILGGYTTNKIISKYTNMTSLPISSLSNPISL